MRSLFFRVVFISIFCASPWAYALPGHEREGGWDYSNIFKQQEAKKLFADMSKDSSLPEWIDASAVETPASIVFLDSVKFYVMSACKQHACISEKIAVMYSPEKKMMYGVVFEASADGNMETLNWLNIDGDAEFTVEKTILYAEINGSLMNHPDVFDFVWGK